MKRHSGAVCVRRSQRLGVQDVARVAVSAGTSDAITTLMNGILAVVRQQLEQLNRMEEQLQHSPLIDSLRADISSPVLAHHDRLRSRGRRSVAEVRHGVCSGCHMGLPIGTVAALKHQSSLLKCENCGRFIFHANEELAAAPLSDPAKKPTGPKRR